MIAYPPTATPPPWSNRDITLYHGTEVLSATDILTKGVALTPIVVPLTPKPDNDFGLGFYTTTLRRQAEAWAWQRVSQISGAKPAVVSFTVGRDALAKLDVLWFIRGAYDADDFWSFVFHCRLGNPDHRRTGVQRWYDIVVGPVTASWRQRVAFQDYDQVSFHTKDALDMLNASSNRRVL